jgi:LysR family transcriptional regulator of gallate degradation
LNNPLPTPTDLEQHLHNLRIFVSVADAKSITRASEHLFKASSAITRSIIEFERAVGVPLFERQPRGMLINAYGEAVLTRARRIDEEIQQGADDFLRLTERQSRPSRSAIINMLYSGRKLQLLIRLAELRNISTVAASMDLTQAGASMALSRIEGILGQSLFQRRMEGMVATEATERMVMRARRVLAELRLLESDLSGISGEVSGKVVLGATPGGRTHYFPTAIATVIGQHPGVRVAAVEGTYEQLVRSLRAGDIDLVFGVLRPTQLTTGLVSEPLFTDRMAVLTGADHPLAGQPDLTLPDLVAQQWILPPANALGRAQIDAYFGQWGLAPPIPSVETGDLATLRQLLSATRMIAITSPLQLMFEIQSGLLAELPVSLPGTERDIGLILREGAMLSPAALAVLEAVRSQAGARPGSIDR